MPLHRERHPLSALLPNLTAEEIGGLRESISALGVMDPITIYEGMVLDGWNRYTLADEQHALCPEQQLPAGVDPVEYVRSRTRGRNMTPSQLAYLEVSLHEWRASGRPGNSAPGAPFSDSATNDEMARSATVSRRTILQAKEVAAHAVEPVREAVKEGKVSVKKAAQISRLPAEQQEQALTAPPVREMAAAAAAAAAPPAPEEDNGYLTPGQIMEQQEARIRDLEEQLVSAQAVDAAKELIKLRTLVQVSERRQGELMQAVAEREAELKRQAKVLRAACEALGVDDPSRIVSALKALKKATT